MKFFTALVAFGLFSSSIASPVAGPIPEVSERQYDSEVILLTDLYNNILTHTAIINNTILSLPKAPTDIQTASSGAAMNTAVAHITGLINAAAVNVGAADKVRPRQANGVTVVNLLGLILLELSGALNHVVARWGLVAFLDRDGLTGALSLLIHSLKLVVDNLLFLVQKLLDDILTGLSLALEGIQW